MTFEPREHLTKVKGQDYMEVRWRIAWFRDAHPQGLISTELLPSPNGIAIFRAVVSKEVEGAFATGHGACRFDQFDAPFEKAETKAIGRALANLGFGVQFSGADFEDDFEASPPRPQGQALPARDAGRTSPPPVSGNQGANEQVAQQYQQQAAPQTGDRPTPGQVKFMEDLLTRKVYPEHHGEAVAQFNNGDMDPSSFSRRDISAFIDHLKVQPDLPGTPRYSR